MLRSNLPKPVTTVNGEALGSVTLARLNPPTKSCALFGLIWSEKVTPVHERLLKLMSEPSTRIDPIRDTRPPRSA